MRSIRLLAVTALAVGGLTVGWPLPAGATSSGAAAIWTFDELSGSACADTTVPVADLSGNGNAATLTPTAARTTAVAPIPHNDCAMNSGGNADQYASAQPSGTLDQSGDFTVAGWGFWESNTPPSLAYILSKDDPATAESNYNLGVWDSHAFFSLKLSGTLTVGTPTSGSGGCDAAGCYIKGDSTLYQSAFQQHHIAGVYSAGTLSVYVDGQLDGQVSITGGTPVTNSQPVWIGQRKFSAAGWNGKIDDVRIYNRALGSDEVAALADYSNFSVSLSPASEWNMSGASHTVTGTVTPNLGHIPVDFTVTGRNPATDLEWAGNDGLVNYTYTDNNGSLNVYDTIVAKVDSATGTNVGQAMKYWVNTADQNFCTISPLANQQITDYAVLDGMLYSRSVEVSVPASGPIAAQNLCLYFANVSGGPLTITAPAFTSFSTPKGVDASFTDNGFGYPGFVDQTDFNGEVTVSGITLQKNGLVNNTHLRMTFSDGTNTYTIPIDVHFTGR